MGHYQIRETNVPYAEEAERISINLKAPQMPKDAYTWYLSLGDHMTQKLYGLNKQIL